MALESRRRGNLDSRERPDSPEWDFSTQRTACTRTFEGLYAQLYSQRPKVGEPMNGSDYSGLLIENVKLKKAVSGKTTMTVILKAEVASAENNSFPEPFQPVFEIEWVSLERPLEQNDYFRTLFNVPTPINSIVRYQALLYNWESATDPAEKQAAFNELAADESGKLKELAGRKLCGETTYMLFAPVARITSQARNVTSVGPCGRRYDAVPGFPGGALPTGYKWLSTADRSTRTGLGGKWQRVQEWTGATHIDSRSYPNASGQYDSES